MYISATALSISETLRIVLRTYYKKLSNIIINVKYATGEVSSHKFKCDRDGRGSVLSIFHIEKGPKHLTKLCCQARFTQQVRSYATRGRKRKLVPVVELNKDFQILAKHWRVANRDRTKVFKDLRGLLKLENIWFAAYLKIKGFASNKGSATPGPDLQTIDTLTKRRIIEIRAAVLKKEYTWFGTKEVLIPKPGKPGKTRPLGIPAINDRLVQEVIRTIIEPIFELNFSNLSHGFRPNRGCHTALKWINTHMKDATWFIEGDIKSYFPSVDHNILMGLIQKRVTDPVIIKLIRKGLKAKVFPKDSISYVPELGTPQGGILSPLLSNIYLDEFDKYMYSFMEEFTTTEKPRRNPAIEKYYKSKSKKDIYRLKIPYYDPKDKNYIKVKYIRYADDFLIGVNGDRKLAETIRERIGNWLKENLKLELSKEKTLITHISKGIGFLGYTFGSRRRAVFTKQKYGVKLLTRKMVIPTLDVDMGRVMRRLNEAGYCDKGGVPVPNFKHLQLPQSETNNKVNYIIQGLSNWWSIAGNRKRAIARINFIIRVSLAKMYAAKFRLKTAAAVFKLGKNDLSSPIGVRAKSVIGVDENGITNTNNKLVGIKFSEYNKIPGPLGNKIGANWVPEYLKTLEENKEDNELIVTLWKEGLSSSRNPIAKLGARLQYTLSSQEKNIYIFFTPPRPQNLDFGDRRAVWGSTENVQNHTEPIKNIKEKDTLKRHIEAINIKQVPLCRKHHFSERELKV